ncbi:hypothetical protein FQN54_009103 [Arachnomyces sp. PD_36]|nr:hypothetical protein FQN54_009103 [Arachnomyces sp. PD_36]
MPLFELQTDPLANDTENEVLVHAGSPSKASAGIIYGKAKWDSFNEKHESSRHYLKFNLPKLLEVAVDAVGLGAKSCVKVLKCAEGLHNKGFLLTMDNGAEVFAKLPNPNAGPAHYTTASEVATREFVREMFQIPVPRVLTWASDSRNPVGAEYIIEEKASGVKLGSVWKQWPRGSKLKIITQIAEFEEQLASVSFQKHGAIYFKKDLQGQLADDANTLLIDPQASSNIDRFAMGPLACSELWQSGRESMELDRGPWKDSSQYTRAIGHNEIAWIKSHAFPRMNYYRSTKTPQHPDEALSLLSQYMEVASYLVPRDGGDDPKVLWHPDLHLDNVFVDPETLQITAIIDWQSASVAPLFFHIPERPDGYEDLSEDKKQQIDEDLEGETIHKYYESQVYKRSPRHWAFLQQRSIPVMRKPVWLVTGAWENKDLFFLRQSLLSLASHWDELFPNDIGKCPLKFTEQELQLHAEEEENMDGVGQMLTLFRDQGVLPVDGMVDPEDFEVAKENSRKFKDVFVGLAKDEAERELFSKLWPYQDSED